MTMPQLLNKNMLKINFYMHKQNRSFGLNIYCKQCG